MGVDTDDPGFERVIGLRVHARRTTIQLPWPELTSFPPFGLVMPREGFDHLLAQRAVKAGARLLERTEAIEPVFVDGYVRGATVRTTGDRDAEPGDDPRALRDRRRRRRQPVRRSPPGSAAIRRRPLGIAARRYYRVDYHPGPWIESWLDLWDGDLLLPGYGWLFPVAGGRINLGAGLLNTFTNFKDVSAQQLFAAFARMMPPNGGSGEDTAEGRVLSGPLPMGMNRTPPAVPGLLLVGDAGGAVNPFNGEGIAYAMETGAIAAELVHEALVRDRPGADDAVRPGVAERTAGTSRSGGNSPR